MEYKLSETAKIIVHQDGTAEIIKSMPIGIMGTPLDFRMPLTAVEFKQLHRLMIFEDFRECKHCQKRKCTCADEWIKAEREQIELL
jgi:hypothetical protein